MQRLQDVAQAFDANSGLVSGISLVDGVDSGEAAFEITRNLLDLAPDGSRGRMARGSPVQSYGQAIAAQLPLEPAANAGKRGTQDFLQPAVRFLSFARHPREHPLYSGTLPTGNRVRVGGYPVRMDFEVPAPPCRPGKPLEEPAAPPGHPVLELPAESPEDGTDAADSNPEIMETLRFTILQVAASGSGLVQEGEGDDTGHLFGGTVKKVAGQFHIAKRSTVGLLKGNSKYSAFTLPDRPDSRLLPIPHEGYIRNR